MNTDDEHFRALFARVMAAGTMAEVLMASYLAERPSRDRKIVFDILRNAGKDIGPSGKLSDATAEFMADVRVRADEVLDHMIARVEHLLAGPAAGS